MNNRTDRDRKKVLALKKQTVCYRVYKDVQHIPIGRAHRDKKHVQIK